METDFYKTTQFDDTNYVLEYKRRFEELDILNFNVIKYSNEDKIVTGVGDYCSPLVVVLKDHSQDNVLEIYKKILKNYELKISDIYVTYMCKCSNNNINVQAFKKEVDILKQGAVFLTHGFNARNMPCDSIFVDYDKYKNMIDITVNDDKEKMNEEYMSLKQSFTKDIINAFGYLNSVKNK